MPLPTPYRVVSVPPDPVASAEATLPDRSPERAHVPPYFPAYPQNTPCVYPSSPPCCSRREATTAGSARVVVSPRTRPSATSRSRRRMILPERVLGSSAVRITSSGRQIAPSFLAVNSFSSVQRAWIAALSPM